MEELCLKNDKEIALIKNDQINMAYMIQDLRQSNKDEHRELKELILQWQSELKELLKGKADKWVETVFRWIMVFIASSILWWICYYAWQTITYLIAIWKA